MQRCMVVVGLIFVLGVDEKMYLCKLLVKTFLCKLLYQILQLTLRFCTLFACQFCVFENDLHRNLWNNCEQCTVHRNLQNGFIDLKMYIRTFYTVIYVRIISQNDLLRTSLSACVLWMKPKCVYKLRLSSQISGNHI